MPKGRIIIKIKKINKFKYPIIFWVSVSYGTLGLSRLSHDIMCYWECGVYVLRYDLKISLYDGPFLFDMNTKLDEIYKQWTFEPLL